jgi:hypothetical protein
MLELYILQSHFRTPIEPYLTEVQEPELSRTYYDIRKMEQTLSLNCW